jgi:small multidrug resistance family-3 protein
MSVISSLGLFVLAGLCEIGGGYLIWLALRENRHWMYAALGAVVLIFYGIIPTLQPAHFGRVYAAYGECLSCCHCCGAWQSTAFSRTAMTQLEPYFV